MRWSILAILLSGSGALVGTGWQALAFVQDARRNDGTAAQSGDTLLRPDHPLIEWLPFLEALPPEAAFASPLVAIAGLALVYWVMRLIGFIVTTVTVAAVVAGVAFVAYPKESAQFFSSTATTARSIAVEQGWLQPADDAGLAGRPGGYVVPYRTTGEQAAPRFEFQPTREQAPVPSREIGNSETSNGYGGNGYGNWPRADVNDRLDERRSTQRSGAVDDDGLAEALAIMGSDR